ncbi:hypothetical protein HMPREF3169_06955 [Corynebacterium sp. HMSC08C04]|uniref:DUF3043 domain-containing protein n=1 Tax=Corynebacterium simulans TaxID=146827 RepID=A0ABR5V9E9_9CORY|nr:MULTISPECIES: DUF3043 domain-containing protein [Corynebacterium]MDU3174020.1 DUF3043 domain-containing protein [Corynebacterium striatum]KXU18087.1 hypothetical protein WM41_1649 [Corynebacterium simulans]MCG7246325.1 DUF3043 domain-containing protein [Corynebacterium simulans]OFQ49177.1 hypothetical protein HMPREF2935_12500 [Corynebacterium sp. HMSC076D02]OFR37794.1 hypothetical protein HMPREF2888_02120 [Corynebacterium sp. HMSC077D03]
MKLPWQKDEKADGSAALPASQMSETPAAKKPEEHRKGYTPPKGRPTPKRDQQEIARGVKRDPHGMSEAQRYQHRKEMKASMSKEEWKAYKRKEREESRAANRLAQERMASGDERYLLPRDKGEVRRYVRDWVDSRKFINEWMMPMMLLLLVVMMLANFSPNVANWVNIFAMVVIAVIAIEGFWLARQCNNAVRLKFPGTTEAGFGLGFYAYTRASQPRKWRTPKPRVERGATV